MTDLVDADLVDALAGLAPDSPVAALRRRRPDALRHTQGSHDVLLLPAEEAGFSRAERAMVALHLAEQAQDAALADHYRALLGAAGGMPPPGPRREALLRHAALLAEAPGEATAADLRRLEAAGFSARAIVALSELIAFVAYQVRLVAGLRLLAAEN